MENNIAVAKLNKLRMSPRKVMLVAAALRNLDYVSAKRVLKFADKAAAVPLLKLLESVKENAKNKDLKEEGLFIKEVLVGPGATLKRGRFVSRGGHHKIMKRTTNITIKLAGENKEKPMETKQKSLKKGENKEDGK
ncbi:MAG: uL22 family ribosomal protein [bacterium]